MEIIKIVFLWTNIKNRTFQWILKKKFSSLTPFYILKVTKFLVKIVPFELLVMKKKNIFVYQLFLSLNISDFSLLFYVKIAPPPLQKGHPLFPTNPPIKIKVLPSPPFWKFGRRFNPPPQQKGGRETPSVVKHGFLMFPIMRLYWNKLSRNTRTIHKYTNPILKAIKYIKDK